MPKLKTTRSKALRTNCSSPKFVEFLPKMASPSSKVSRSEETFPFQNLADNLVSSVAAKQKPTQYKDFDEEFSCSNCSSLLFHPVTAQCGHSFCARCRDESLTYCRHCKKAQQPSSLSKLNVTLNAIIERWYPDQCVSCELVADGDRLMKTGSFLPAESKFSEAMQKNPYDIYSITRRALARKEAGRWKEALADIVSAKVRTKFIPEEFKSNASDFSLIAAREESIVQKAVKMFLEVMLLLDSPTSASSKNSSRADDDGSCLLKCGAEDYVGDVSSASSSIPEVKKTFSENKFVDEDMLSELNNSLDGIISGNMCDFQAFLQRGLSEPKSQIQVDQTNDVTSRNSAEYAGDFSCILCTRPFYEPVCTPCGHTFCFGCLQRCFDHGRACPMCKTSLKEMFKYQKCQSSVDWSVDSILRKYLPSLCEHSATVRQKERDKLGETLPVFVCTVAFPSVQCNLHVFEPRYRLMIRRAQRIHDGSFGMTVPSSTAPFHGVGTVISLENVSFYEDGRSLVTSVGTKRFKVQEYGTCDGYNTAKVKFIVDEVEIEENDVRETEKMAVEVYEKASKWFGSCPDQLKSGIKRNFGAFPERDITRDDNGPNWHWWVLAVLPVSNDVKVYVLGKNRLRPRLAVLNLILQKLQGDSQT